ncbi:MAG: hypothetical protein IRZ14_09485 [Chloroflexi bacterium]|nr:hypothetical protein [Chloroflexota bacterium]
MTRGQKWRLGDRLGRWALLALLLLAPPLATRAQSPPVGEPPTQLDTARPPSDLSGQDGTTGADEAAPTPTASPTATATPTATALPWLPPLPPPSAVVP